jgi:hypothetical protein
MDAIEGVKGTIIYCDVKLRDRWWPEPLAKEWMLQYPGLFDFDDFRQAINQQTPKKHFYEWYAAIHLFQRDGSISLVEKCDSPRNPVKYERYVTLVSQEMRDKLKTILDEWKVQLPDLMVIKRDHRTVAFAEVKGPGDSLHKGQPESLKAIRELDFEIEMIEVVSKDVLQERDGWRKKSRIAKGTTP